MLLVNFREEDKRQHLGYSYAILLLFWPFTSLFVATLITALIGISKEVWDKYRGTGFCWYDMQANFFGILLAVATIRLGETLVT